MCFLTLWCLILFRRFYRWFPNFEERFTKDKDGHYQPINGHENEVKYRAEMRAKSMKIVTAKRSDAITKKKYERNKKIVEEVATNEARMFSRQVSYNTTNSNNTSRRNIPGDIQIDIVAPSPTTTPPKNNNNSFHIYCLVFANKIHFLRIWTRGYITIIMSKWIYKLSRKKNKTKKQTKKPIK